MSLNCPYCPPDNPNIPYEAWSDSPEFLMNAKEIHDKEHCHKCPCCGQLIQNEKN